MGRKIEMKKIEDIKKSQVTFSKRRTSLIKKAEQIAISCDVDVAFVAFSTSGRISKFCNRERTEDLLNRYVNLPVEKRLSHMKNIQEKLKKLQELGNNRDEDEKLHYLNNQIERLELQLKKKEIKVLLAEADIRDFEVHPEQDASLHQIAWCEKNLLRMIGKLKEIKIEKLAMEKGGIRPWLHHGDRNSLLFPGSSSSNGQHQMQFDSWKNNPHIARVPTNIFDEMLGKGKGKEVVDSSKTTLQLGVPVVPETLVLPSYNSTWQNYRFGKEPLVHWKQAESSSSSGNFSSESSNLITRDFLSDPSTFRESSNNAKNASADASNYWEVFMLQNQPSLVLNLFDLGANEEGTDWKENHDTSNELMVSSPSSVEATLLTARVSSPILYDFFPSKGSFGRQCTKDSEDSRSS